MQRGGGWRVCLCARKSGGESRKQGEREGKKGVSGEDAEGARGKEKKERRKGQRCLRRGKD